MKEIIKFSEKTNNIVDGLNTKLIKEGKLSTNPMFLHYFGYDSYNFKTNKTPEDSIYRYTITGLKHIFPLIDIKLCNNDEIYIEGNLFEFSAIPNKDHIEYIKEIMLDIFLLYQNDESKIPKKIYKWYFENET